MWVAGSSRKLQPHSLTCLRLRFSSMISSNVFTANFSAALGATALGLGFTSAAGAGTCVSPNPNTP
jgi:hypothetical protein